MSDSNGQGFCLFGRKKDRYENEHILAYVKINKGYLCVPVFPIRPIDMPSGFYEKIEIGLKEDQTKRIEQNLSDPNSSEVTKAINKLNRLLDLNHDHPLVLAK